MKIRVPAGTHALFVGAIENEIILPRGMRYLIIDKKSEFLYGHDNRLPKIVGRTYQVHYLRLLRPNESPKKLENGTYMWKTPDKV